MPPLTESPIFTVEQAAEYLQVGRKLVYRLCQQKKLTFIKVDERGTIRVHRDALDDFVAKRKGQS